jgi:hypothetical protein
MTEKAREHAVRASTLFIDEIEDDSARLLLGERSLVVPRSLLPEDAREGDWLLFQVARTEPPSDDAAGRRARMGRDDPGGDIKL